MFSNVITEKKILIKLYCLYNIPSADEMYLKNNIKNK